MKTRIVLVCLGLVSENFWDVSSQTKNQTSRSHKVLVNVSPQSRHGCNVKRLDLRHEGLVHITGARSIDKPHRISPDLCELD